MGSLRYEIKKLAHELEEEENAAFDLWSWLPSNKAAKANHGDFHFEFKPTVADIMKEAAVYFAFLKNPDIKPIQREGWFECPCGECEGPEFCRNCDLYADQLMRCKAIESAPYCDEGKPHKKCPFIRGNGGFGEKMR